MKSPQFNEKIQEFDNRIPGVHKRAIRRISLKNYFGILLCHGKNSFPKTKLPEVKFDKENFLNSNDEIKFVWIGHSSLLLRLGDKNLLIDPVFSKYASPVPLTIKRFQKPVLTREELPEIHYILLTHDHYDHLDRGTVKYFKDKNVTFICPLGVPYYLKKWGIKEENIIEKDWGDSIKLNEITVTLEAAQHASGRIFHGPNKSLWCSYILQYKDKKLFMSGDSAYDIHFKRIGEQYGPFDLAFMECGQFNKIWHEIHMLPEESIKAFFDLKAKLYVPIHWGMYKLGLHSWSFPMEKLEEKSKGLNFPFIVPMLGEVVSLNSPPANKYWWKNLQG